MSNTQVLAKATLPKKKLRALLHDLLFVEVGKFVNVTPLQTVGGKIDVEVTVRDILDGDVIKNLFHKSITSGGLHERGWGNELILAEA
jgi:hypothetical protein